MARFKKGMKVMRTFYGIGGYVEGPDEDVVESVKGNVVRTEQCDGLTFDAKTGKELENFFSGIHQEIVPLKEHLAAQESKAVRVSPSSRRPQPTKTRKRAPKRPQRDSRRLSMEDCANPMFDRQRPVQRSVDGRRAYEWVTVTDGFVQVGCTYFLDDGTLHVVAFEPRNLPLYDRPVYTPEQFALAMKTVDRAFERKASR